MVTLETERLALRPWRPEDLDDLYEYAKNPNVGPNAGWKPHESREESAGILRKFMDQGEVWALEFRESGKVMGSVGLHADRFREGINGRMVGYVLSEDCWGRGLMTEAVRRVVRYAFEEMGLDILSVYHYPHNMRSRRVIEKCGFHHEGALRMTGKIYDGTVRDSVCYSITRDEYFLRIKENPWIRIDLAAYEEHMGAEGVLQTQALNGITAEQLAGAHGRVALLGAAGGNGLEHVDPAFIEKIYAVDINGKFLEACRERYARLGGALETVCLDLSEEGAALPACNMMICNLIVEYLGARRFAGLMGASCAGGCTVSCVIQKSRGSAFVSESPAAKKLESLEPLHRDIGEEELTDEMKKAGFDAVFKKAYPLPNAKEFVRIDFQKQNE
jgi:ribosomal-protein-alanine N-acetyltransferase